MGKITRAGAAVAVSALALAMAPAASFAGSDNNTLQLTGNTGHRISGLDRFEVSVNAATQLDKDLGANQSSTVIIASGMVWPDGITVAPLADCLDAPVLLTWSDRLPAVVAKYLRDREAAGTLEKVIITGGPATVSPAIEAELADIFGYNDPAIAYGDQVERISGQDRYNVAYNTAADTAACQGSVSEATTTALQDAKDTLSGDMAAEASYQYWVKEYAAAKAAYDKAEKVLWDLVQEKAALTAKYNALVAKLTPTSDPAPPLCVAGQTWNECLAAAVAALNTANSTLQAELAARSVFSDKLGAQPEQGVTTLDINSTIGQYKAAFPSMVTTINNAIATLGLTGVITDATTLNSAIDQANGVVNAQQATVDTAASHLADVQDAFAANAAANAANAPIFAQMSTIAQQIAALNAKIAAQEKIVGTNAVTTWNSATDGDDNTTDLYERWQDAAEMLAYWTTQRPSANKVAIDMANLAKARDAAVKEAGEVPAFLATGRIFTDALSSGPAAANASKTSEIEDGVVLLTAGTTLGPWTQRWFDLSKSQAVAVGGDAIAAIGSNTTIKFTTVPGANRFDVSVALANKYFTNDRPVAIASGEIFSDALTAGSFIAQYDGPLLLTWRDTLPATVDNYLRGLETPVESSVIIGGPATVTNNVAQQIYTALDKK